MVFFSRYTIPITIYVKITNLNASEELKSHEFMNEYHRGTDNADEQYVFQTKYFMSICRSKYQLRVNSEMTSSELSYHLNFVFFSENIFRRHSCFFTLSEGITK